MKKVIFLMALVAIGCSCKVRPDYVSTPLPELEQTWADAIQASYPNWVEPIYLDVRKPSR